MVGARVTRIARAIVVDWSEIGTKVVRAKKLECLQLFLWVGAMLPAEIALFILSFFVKLFPLDNLPTPAFVFQRFAWYLKMHWLGVKGVDLEQEDIRFRSFPRNSPKLWESVIWGPCFRFTPASMHPLWLFWTHRSVLLKSKKESTAL